VTGSEGQQLGLGTGRAASLRSTSGDAGHTNKVLLHRKSARPRTRFAHFPYPHYPARLEALSALLFEQIRSARISSLQYVPTDQRVIKDISRLSSPAKAGTSTRPAGSSVPDEYDQLHQISQQSANLPTGATRRTCPERNCNAHASSSEITETQPLTRSNPARSFTEGRPYVRSRSCCLRAISAVVANMLHHSHVNPIGRADNTMARPGLVSRLIGAVGNHRNFFAASTAGSVPVPWNQRPMCKALTTMSPYSRTPYRAPPPSPCPCIQLEQLLARS